MIRKGHSDLSLKAQCKLLNVHRSGIYYKPQPESSLNLELMRLMDEHYLHHPYKGAPRMYTWLTRDKGYAISRNRVERLYYRCMGLQAVMPGRHTSRRHKAHKVYPYLLRNLQVSRPNQIWAMDITYIPMKKGFMYMVAIIDLYSRYIVGWSISNSMDADWCREVLEEAIVEYGQPEIINTDQGSQFTSDTFTRSVLSRDIRLSMDGKGRAIDNVFIERFWRTLKYEEIYLKPPADGVDLYAQVTEFMTKYNHHRRHSSLDDRIPSEVYTKIEQAA